MNELLEYLEDAIGHGVLTWSEARRIVDDRVKYDETTAALTRLVDRFGRRCEG